MEWIFTESSFTYNGTPVTRRKATCKTIIGNFVVSEAVNGNTFIKHPLLTDGKYPVAGVGLDEWFGDPKKFVDSVEHGISECEHAMAEFKKIILSY